MKEHDIYKYIKFNSEVTKINIIKDGSIKAKYEIECNNEVNLN